MLLRYLVVPILIHQAWGQTPTAIDLRAQSRNVDFTSAATTRPFKSGTTMPSACSVGEMFYLTAATAGANLYGCTSANTWTLESAAGGAQSASQLTDLIPALGSQTLLTIGANCSVAAPCNVRIGSVTHSFTSSTSATISAGTGTAFFYLDPSGTLSVGHTMTVNCASGCLAVPGISAFPSNAIPLFTWTASNGVWNAGGGVDWRAFESTTNIGAGSGLLGATANGVTTLAIDPTLVGLWVPVPGTSSSTCTKGTWSVDTSFYYVCVAANSWRRTALTTW
ncbi:MAG: hypothetical protein LAP38_21545 [Acidobacteriia bacterium]|nr:hypothetical protein [Terriglobia bacterium]